MNDQSAHPRDILAVFICGGGVHNILNDWIGDPWTTMFFGILIVVLAALYFRAWHRKRWVRR